MADIDIKLLKELDEGIKRADFSLQNFSKTLTELGTQYSAAFENSKHWAVGLRKDLDALSTEIKDKSSDIAKAVNKVSQDFADAATLEGKALSDKVINANDFRKSAEDALNAALSVITKGQTQQLLQQSIAGISGLDINTLPTAMRRKILQRQAQVEREGFETRTNPDFAKLNKAQYDAMVAALGNYKKAIDQLTDAQHKANTAALRYYDIASKLKKVPEEYDKIILQQDMLKQKFSDLQVMKMAGILDEKEFKRVSQVILNQYDELIKKKKAFELTDIDRASNKRKKDQADALRLQQRYYADIKRKEDEIAKVKQQHKATEKKMATNTSAEVKKAVEDQYKSEQAYIRELERQLKRLQAWRNYASKVSGVSNDTALSRGTRAAEASAKRRYDAERQYANAVRQTAESEARAAEKRHRQALQASRDFNTITSTVRKLAAALGLTASLQGIANFGRKLIEVRGEFELQQVALRSILQNKQLADEIWDKTMQAALQSPFTAMQLTRYTKQLAAYRIETEKLFDTTKRLADISAGLGVDMQRLILAYGQVKAANYLRASEIRQFTEAGVNVLGELAHYFSDTRDKMYSTAEIMDMVQKRMVKFEDVEAIFKRMTDAGGIFYNMQYVQSQTVKGQINKLHDAYDQMLNSIGKANTGALRNMVSLLLNIVKNWREWKTVLDSIAIPAFIIVLIKFGKGLVTAGASARIASNELRGLELAGTKARLSLAALNRTMKSFKFGGTWGLLGIGAAITALAALYNHAEAVRATNKEYDEQKNRLRETIRSFEDYQKRVEDNNEIIRNRTTLSKDDADAQKKVTDAQEDNKKILNKLTADYPEYAKQIKIATDKQIDLGTILTETNEKLREQAGLLEASKAGFGYEDVKENVEEYQAGILKQQDQAENNYQVAINARQEFLDKRELQLSELRQQEEDLRYLYNKGDITERKYNKSLESIDEERNKILSKREDTWITKIIESGRDAQKQMENWQTPFISKKGTGAGLLVYPTGYDERLFFSDFQKDTKVLEDDLNGNLDRLTSRIRQMYVRQIEKLNKGTVEDVRQYVADNGTIVENWFKYGEGAGWEDINTSIVKWAEAMGVSLTETRQLIQKKISQTLGDAYGADLLIDWDAILNSATNQTTPDKVGKTYKSIDNIISLLKTMNSEYNRLSKSAFGWQQSQERVREIFKDSFKDILKAAKGSGYALEEAFTMVDWKNLDITSKGGIGNALQQVYDYLTNKKMWGEFGKNAEEVRKKFKKEIDTWNVEIPIDAQVRIREDLGRQIEKAFGDYELTLDLHKLNLPAGLAEELWNVEDVDLSDLRAKVSNMFDELKDKNGELTADAIKDYENYLKKIDDLERKQQRERLKEYSKYLEYQYSERTKIEMDYVRKLSQLEASAIPEPQKKDIRTGIRREYEEALKKQDWEDFKGSEFYVQMMEDLGKQGSASLELMRDKLKKMRDNAENLSPRALKEVVNALEKIDEIERSRTAPLQRLRTATEEINNALNKNNLESINQAYEVLAINQKTVAEKEKQAKEVERMIMLENERQRLERSGYDVESLRPEEAERILESYRAKAFKAQNDLAAFRSDGKKESEQTRANLEEAANREQRLVELWQSIVEVIKGGETITSLQKSSEFYGYSESDLKKRRDDLKDEIKQLQGQGNKYDELVQKIKELQLAWNATFESIKDWGQRVSSVFNDVMDTVEFFEDSTYGLTAAWKEFGNETYNTLNDLIMGIQEFKSAQIELQKLQEGSDAAKALMSGSYVKIALMLLGVLLKIVQAVAKLNDNYKNAEIERQQEKVDSLTRAYERLERKIEKTFESTKYMRTYNEQLDNLRQQIAAFEAQRAAEESKKNTDKNAVNGYTDAIEDAYNKIAELKERQLELFGGIGESGYRDAAQGFVEAWKSAFLETGDGLSGLQQHFDEFLQDWFVKQATMQGVAKYYQKVFDYINGVVEDGNVPTYQQIEAARQLADEAAVQSDAFMQALAGVFGNFGGDGSLSGLAAGIQGMTEEQANILEAYWNSVRMYTASIDGNVSRIAEMLGANGPNSNPMLTQLQAIAANTNYIPQIYNLLMNTRRNNGNGQGFLTYSM